MDSVSTLKGCSMDDNQCLKGCSAEDDQSLKGCSRHGSRDIQGGEGNKAKPLMLTRPNLMFECQEPSGATIKAATENHQ